MDRARRGGSGALNPQSALAGLNSLSRGSGPRGQRAANGVDGRVPRGAGSRTRSGPEGSSLKRSPAGVAGSPAPELAAANALGEPASTEGARSVSPHTRGPLEAGLDSPSRAARVRLPLPPSPPPDVRRRRRARARRSHAAQRDRARPGPPYVPVRRLARDREDVDGEDPRRVAELRRWPDRQSVRRLRVVPLD